MEKKYPIGEYVEISIEDHDLIIKGQTNGLSLEAAVFSAGYQRGKQEQISQGDDPQQSGADKLLTSYEKFFKECWPRLIDREVTDEREINSAWEVHKRLQGLM